MLEEIVCGGGAAGRECVYVCVCVCTHHTMQALSTCVYSMPDLLMPPSPEISDPRKSPNPISSP